MKVVIDNSFKISLNGIKLILTLHYINTLNMHINLRNLVSNTIILNYSLPCSAKGINKSSLTHISLTDDCYKVLDLSNFCRIIYESILYYSYSDFNLNGGNRLGMFSNAFGKKFKYDAEASAEAKLKLGIYGEALFYSMLRCYYGNDVLISRGLFYDIQKKSEITGYDCFHLVESNNELALWFGETKFHQTHQNAITSVFKSIEEALSYNYLETNLYTILQHRGDITDDSEHKITNILDRWGQCVITNLEQELIDNNIKLVYPVLLTYDMIDNDYDKSIRSAIRFINEKAVNVNFDNIRIDYSIFFILVPIENTKTSKETIIRWIDNNEPLVLLDN